MSYFVVSGWLKIGGGRGRGPYPFEFGLISQAAALILSTVVLDACVPNVHLVEPPDPFESCLHLSGIAS